GPAYLIRGRTRPDTGRPPPAAERQQPAELIPGVEHTIRLSPDAAGQFGLKTTEVQKARPPKPLQLPGTLLLDSNHLARVRTRFAGEIVEISTLESATADPSEL